jgi:hypothetical protein
MNRRPATFILAALAMGLWPRPAAAQRVGDVDLDGRRRKRQAIVYAPSANPAPGRVLSCSRSMGTETTCGTSNTHLHQAPTRGGRGLLSVLPPRWSRWLAGRKRSGR